MDLHDALSGDGFRVFYGAADLLPNATEGQHQLFGLGFGGRGGGAVDEIESGVELKVIWHLEIAYFCDVALEFVFFCLV